MIIKWPAVILAIKRTDKVIGRIKFLTLSIITINIIKSLGVPKGNKWANIWLVLKNQPKIIKLIQIGNAILKVIHKCLEGVKT